MRGLLVKDFRLVMQQKLFFAAFLFVGGAIAVVSQSVYTGSGYIIGISWILGITTINYDSYDKGFLFLFTLPVSRKKYVKEKYAFAVLSSLIVTGTMNVLLWLVMAAVHSGAGCGFLEYMGIVSECYMITLLMIAVVLPIFLEFGPEKSRFVILIIVGIFVVMTGPWTFFEEGPLELIESAWIRRAVSLMITLLLMAVSYALSCIIMEEKEF